MVTQICSQIDPYWVPWLIQSLSCVTIPLGWPQKNLSTTFALVRSCQPPMMRIASNARAPQTASLRCLARLRARAAIVASSDAATLGS